MIYIIGLGNPGEEYEETRHNTGRMAVDFFHRSAKFPEWKIDKKSKSLISKGKIGKTEVLLIKPETFMNKSGISAASFVTSVKKARDLIVIYDDLDLPLGKMKISFNRGAGGHRGIESIEKSLKTREFGRLRIGISSQTPGGKLKKPQGEKAVVDFILGKFRKSEGDDLKKVFKNASHALQMIISEGLEKAMGEYN